MLLNILSIAFRFAPVGPNAVGGAEQILSRLDRALVAAGHNSMVVACESSQIQGELFPFALPAGEPPPAGKPSTEPALTELDQLGCAAAVQNAIDRALASRHVDVIHMHGLDLDAYTLPAEIPVLISLHLPVAWYRPALWSKYAGRAQFCCVSESQRRSLPAQIHNEIVIENGVHLPPIENCHKGNFALALGRVCPEKNAHEAFDAGTLAGTRVLLGGEVFPYPDHLRYFHQQIEPRVLGIPPGKPQHAFLGRLPDHHKQALLGRAKCLLHPTRAPETSSLVAMEALAAATPVVAYRSGALPEIIDDGVTGFLVDNVQQMAEALGRVHSLSPRACRKTAERRFSAGRMIRNYLSLYETMATRQQVEVLCA